MSVNDNTRPELVLGFVAPLGVDLEAMERLVDEYLKQFGYTSERISLSSLIRTIEGISTELVDAPPGARINSYMTAGNEARRKAERGDLLAALAISEIMLKRETKPLYGRAHLLHSLKHPDEVMVLRKVYQQGFFLIGGSSSKVNRLKYLTRVKDIPEAEAEALIQRDESEVDEHGQHTRETFHLADAFINMDAESWQSDLERVFKLLFGFPYSTPTRDEYAMFMAFSASLRSADLSRQVGAVILSPSGDCLSTGANDVPCSPGGLYWPETGGGDQRDYALGYDSNDKIRNEIVVQVLGKIFPDLSQAELLQLGERDFKDTGIFDITEFGRAVHAEMEALLSCARIGVSTRGGTLFSTTFPCHNCAKHIVAAGIRRVVFVEPYPKSRALLLHKDSVILVDTKSKQDENKVVFEPFVGIGPRRYIDLFSLNLGGGNKLRRKSGGKVVSWQKITATIRFPMLPASYIEREALLSQQLNKQTEG